MFKYKSMFWGTQVLPALWSVSIFSIYTILAIVVVRDAPGTDVAIYCGRPDIRLLWKLDAGSPMWPDIKMFYSLINNTCYIFFLINFSLENLVWLCWRVSGRGSNWRPSALAACNRPFIFIGAWPPRLTFPRRSAIYHSVWAKRPFLLQPSHRSIASQVAGREPILPKYFIIHIENSLIAIYILRRFLPVYEECAAYSVGLDIQKSYPVSDRI